MKKFLLASAVTLGLTFMANAQEIQFTNLGENNTLDYGQVQKGGDGVRVIEFKNVGNAPLVLPNVKASCGCTVPSYEKDPVMPGKSAQIKVKYSTGRVGPINKTVTITSNDTKAPRTVVRLKGKVNDPNAAAQAKAVPAKMK